MASRQEPWWLILGELSCFGMFGVAKEGVALQFLGTAGLITCTLMLIRVRRGTPAHAASVLLLVP